MINQPWTAAEIETIRAMRGKHTQREIAETLGRSTVSVKNKMKSDRLHTIRPVGRQPDAMKVSSGIASRLGITDEEQAEYEDFRKARAAGFARSKEKLAKRRESANEPLEPVLIVSDAHIPYHSPVWWDLLMQVGRYLKPRHLVIIGDFGDFYSVSDHCKDPDKAGKLDWELAEVDKHLDALDALGAKDKLYIEGNHEDRVRRYLMKNPEFARIVTTEKLLKLKERGWEFVPYKDHTARGAIHYTHDVGAAGQNAVFQALRLYQHSVVTGHTHRLAYIVEGSAVGEVKLSCMFGWGGDIGHIDYMNRAKARKDWALGFGVGYYDPSSGYSYLVPVPVVDSTVCVNGRLFRTAVAAA